MIDTISNAICICRVILILKQGCHIRDAFIQGKGGTPNNQSRHSFAACGVLPEAPQISCAAAMSDSEALSR